MLSQFNQFLLNFSLLITSLLFAFLPLRHTERISAGISYFGSRVNCLDVIAGLIGGLLVLNSITYDGAKIDLRLVALVTAFYYGGWVSGGITISRRSLVPAFIITPPGAYDGLILTTLICMALLVTASIYRRFASHTIKDYLILIGIGIGYSLPALVFIDGNVHPVS